MATSSAASKKVAVSVILPIDLEQEIREAMAREGVSPRKKSRWIAEGIDELVSLGADRILNENILTGRCLDAGGGGEKSRLHVLSLEDDELLALVSLIGELRQRDPYAEATQSTLIRAAILRRIERAAR